MKIAYFLAKYVEGILLIQEIRVTLRSLKKKNQNQLYEENYIPDFSYNSIGSAGD